MAAPTEVQSEAGAPDGALHLLVMAPDVFFVRRLAADADVVVGRDEEADVRVADAAASRRHARIRAGSPCTVEDLGSANGTTVRDARIAPGSPVAVHPGEAIVIGSTIIMLQSRASRFRPRRVWPHGYFEARLEEECERADGVETSFAVARVRLAPETRRAEAASPPQPIAGGSGPSQGPDQTPAAAGALAAVLRPGDVLALYGPSNYEALLVETSPAQARALLAEMAAALEPLGPAARPALGLACYPRDGLSAGSLIAAACLAVAGAGADRPAAAAAARAVVTSPPMQAVYELARKAAQGSINVLITGETGAGKEVLARFVHDSSPRAGKPMVCINCAALSEALLESELFGHERGAFTGAAQAKPGLIETAAGGTVFLDEIGEMSLGLQAKILRVIERRELVRVGGLRPLPVDVRFVAATNRDLVEEVAAGEFRQDLFYRLNGIALAVPPLRERAEEIAPLARAFVAEAARALGWPAPPLARAALAALEGYCWPGNVRELRNMMERAVLLSEGAPIDVGHLQMDKMSVAQRPAAAPAAGDEAAQIRDALARCGGNQGRAAQLLGMSRRTFCRRLKDLGIPRPREG
jgi:DNA-binding NtrC family response regulator